MARATNRKARFKLGKFMKIAGLIALAAGLLITAGCSRDRVNNGEAIELKGSDTMVNLAQSWAEEYMNQHPEASIAVTGGGSGTGIAALINGTTDMAMSSRQLKSSEYEQAVAAGQNPQEFVVGYDGLAVIVNPANPVSELTLEQIKDIYTGKIANWQQVGGPDWQIVVLSRESNSGTYIYFREQVLKNENFRPDALLLPSSAAEVKEVANNPAAIAYLGVAYVNEQVKALGIKSGAEVVYPVNEAILSGKYPIARPLFIYTANEPAGLVKKFIEFMFSQEGQDIVGRIGYTPLPK
jgi:phosphate transport system substrate-binding protein